MNRSEGLVDDVPYGVVTEISTGPADRAGLVTAISASLMILTLPAAVVSNFTRFVPVKPDPEIVTAVPPDCGPDAGVTPVILGGAMYVNWSTGVIGDVPAGVITMISTGPAKDEGGLTALMEESPLTWNDVAGVVPNKTPVAAERPLPEMRTFVPPANGPDFGVMPFTAAAVV